MTSRSYVCAALYLVACVALVPVIFVCASAVAIFDFCMKAAPFRDAFAWMLRLLAPVGFLVTRLLKPAYRESYATNGQSFGRV